MIANFVKLFFSFALLTSCLLPAKAQFYPYPMMPAYPSSPSIWDIPMDASTGFDLVTGSYGGYDHTPSPSYSSPSTDYEQRRKDTLNSTVGENCGSCKGSGKCATCNGTKVASSFGNTYTCTVWASHGNCSVCNGTGKASWNR